MLDQNAGKVPDLNRSALLVVFAVFMALVPGRGVPREACQMPDWLVDIYFLSLDIERSAARHEPVIQKSRALLRRLNEIPDAELDRRLEAADMAGHSSEIRAYLRTQRMAASLRLESSADAPLPAFLNDRLRSTSQRIHTLIQSLRCTEDKDWRAASAAARLTSPKAVSPPQAAPKHGPASAPRPLERLEGLSFTLPPLWLIATFLLLIPFIRSGMRLFKAWKADRRRRYRRFYCHIDCLAIILSDGAKRVTHVTIVDISQMGARIHLAAPLPETASGLELILPDRQIEARIVWSNPLYCGVVFKRILPRLALYGLLHRYRDD